MASGRRRSTVRSTDLARDSKKWTRENWVPVHPEAAQNVAPVAVTSQESVQRLRSWATGRCLDAERGGIYAHSQAEGKAISRCRVAQTAPLGGTAIRVVAFRLPFMPRSIVRNGGRMARWTIRVLRNRPVLCFWIKRNRLGKATALLTTATYDRQCRLWQNAPVAIVHGHRVTGRTGVIAEWSRMTPIQTPELRSY